MLLYMELSRGQQAADDYKWSGNSPVCCRVIPSNWLTDWLIGATIETVR